MVAHERELNWQSRHVDVLCPYKAACALLGNKSVSAAHINKEMPTTAIPGYKLPVLSWMKPTANGPANPPRLAIEVIRAMPDAAENPVRNSPGSA